MQEIRWKEPEIIGEIEKQRMLGRPQRVRNLALFWLAAIAIYLLFVFALAAFSVSRDKAFSSLWHGFGGFAPLLVMNLLLGFHSAWSGTPRFADECRVSKLGVTRMNAMQNISWKDIESYRFETDERAPNLRVLVVESGKRKEPLRLYYEGEDFEERLRDAMVQGVDETMKKLRRAGDGALVAKYEIGE